MLRAVSATPSLTTHPRSSNGGDGFSSGPASFGLAGPTGGRGVGRSPEPAPSPSLKPLYLLLRQSNRYPRNCDLQHHRPVAHQNGHRSCKSDRKYESPHPPQTIITHRQPYTPARRNPSTAISPQPAKNIGRDILGGWVSDLKNRGSNIPRTDIDHDPRVLVISHAAGVVGGGGCLPGACIHHDHHTIMGIME